ncbi:MAG TPA: hypothetical protein VLW65_08385 [Bryobacteraceae bacterium]|nr:hypothetical protein [Bryobacteraceae bacterium]
MPRATRNGAAATAEKGIPAAAQLLDPSSASVFVYASLNCVLFFYKVPVAAVTPLLEGTGLVPGVFDGGALINLNFERYAGVSSNYFEPTSEVEFNIVSYRAEDEAAVPALSVDAYLSGYDQTKLYGNFRAHVACSDPTAVFFGTISGEIKMFATLLYNVPSLNTPAVTDWWLRVLDPNAASGANTPYVFDLHACFQNTRPQISPFSPLRDYAYITKPDPVTGQPQRYIVLSLRNVLGQFQRWTPGPDTLQLHFGTSTCPMAVAMQSVLQSAEPVGILVFDSPPAASSTHLTYTVPVKTEVA